MKREVFQDFSTFLVSSQLIALQMNKSTLCTEKQLGMTDLDNTISKCLIL